MKNTAKNPRLSADEIAEKAMSGEDISRFFTNKGEMKPAIQRVNVDLTLDMLRETGTDFTDVEGFSEYPRSIRDVLISVLISEHLKNSVKLSMRSVGDIRVDTVAAEFGGGGHKNASAALIKNVSVDEARDKVLESIKSYLSENNL